jgi:HTH-type transcriptional regulator / antitoxin MqsA
MKCPACGNLETVTRVQEETLSYAGQSLTLHSMKGDFCPACGEGVWDEESYRRYTEAQTAIIRAVKGDVSADIRRIRKSLKLTQTELSEVVGIGKVAFSRYERGETRPPTPLVKLLKLVEKHPDLLAEMSPAFTPQKETRLAARSAGATKKLRTA